MFGEHQLENPRLVFLRAFALQRNACQPHFVFLRVFARWAKSLLKPIRGQLFVSNVS